MPRKARIDATGAVHHIIARGIERMRIFKDSANSVIFWHGEVRNLGDTLRFITFLLLVPQYPYF